VSSTPKIIPLSDSIDYSSKGDGSIGLIRDKVGKLRYLADRVRPDLLTLLGSSVLLRPIRQLKICKVSNTCQIPQSDHFGVYDFGGMDKEVDYSVTVMLTSR
jgi:hypothetical protein